MKSHTAPPCFRNPGPAGFRGFTLIELMVTVAIVAVLATIALPTYRSAMLRAHRSDALATLAQNQAIFERCYALNFVYNGSCPALESFPQTTPQGFYSIALTHSTASAYTLTATPVGLQANDADCASISLDQANQRTALNQNGAYQASCWNP